LLRRSELKFKNSLLKPGRHGGAALLPPPWRSILAFIAAGNHLLDGNAVLPQ
jgi:hypothetical protein